MHKSLIRFKSVFFALVLSGTLLLGFAVSGSMAAGAASKTASTTIPKGVVLRIGDQLDYLETVLSLDGENTNFSYTVQYSAFIGGPPMLQAFQGGALDAGFVGSTPLIFAQAASQPIVAVGGWATVNSAYGLVTSPGNTSIKGWSNLKGKKVAFQRVTLQGDEPV